MGLPAGMYRDRVRERNFNNFLVEELHAFPDFLPWVVAKLALGPFAGAVAIQNPHRASRIDVRRTAHRMVRLTCPLFLHPPRPRDRPIEGTAGMKLKQFSEKQIIGILKEAEAGAVVTQLCRKHGMSSATYNA